MSRLVNFGIHSAPGGTPTASMQLVVKNPLGSGVAYVNLPGSSTMASTQLVPAVNYSATLTAYAMAGNSGQPCPNPPSIMFTVPPPPPPGNPVFDSVTVV